MPLYHGTSSQALPKILKEGLKLRRYDGAGGVVPIWLAHKKEHALAFGLELLEVAIEPRKPYSREEWQLCCYHDIQPHLIKYLGHFDIPNIDVLERDRLSGALIGEVCYRAEGVERAPIPDSEKRRGFDFARFIVLGEDGNYHNCEFGDNPAIGGYPILSHEVERVTSEDNKGE